MPEEALSPWETNKIVFCALHPKKKGFNQKPATNKA